MKWVVKMIAFPALYLFKKSQTDLLVTGSIPDVGSSIYNQINKKETKETRETRETEKKRAEREEITITVIIVISKKHINKIKMMCNKNI